MFCFFCPHPCYFLSVYSQPSSFCSFLPHFLSPCFTSFLYLLSIISVPCSTFCPSTTPLPATQTVFSTSLAFQHPPSPPPMCSGIDYMLQARLAEGRAQEAEQKLQSKQSHATLTLLDRSLSLFGRKNSSKHLFC